MDACIRMYGTCAEHAYKEACLEHATHRALKDACMNACIEHAQIHAGCMMRDAWSIQKCMH